MKTTSATETLNPRIGKQQKRLHLCCRTASFFHSIIKVYAYVNEGDPVSQPASQSVGRSHVEVNAKTTMRTENELFKQTCVAFQSSSATTSPLDLQPTWVNGLRMAGYDAQIIEKGCHVFVTREFSIDVYVVVVFFFLVLSISTFNIWFLPPFCCWIITIITIIMGNTHWKKQEIFSSVSVTCPESLTRSM